MLRHSFSLTRYFKPTRTVYTTTCLVHTKQDKSFQLKTPKGTRDYNEKEMAVRQDLFTTITRIFERHGAVTIDTPVFEMRDILSGKYGEDSKLIYDLADQGGEACSLRYDLTVPFARYLAMQGKKEAQQIKRYQIAKVYRRDQPIMTKGRLREFYQCDFDIAGVYDPLIPDAEVLKVLCDTLDQVKIPFHIKLNHRQILDGLFQVCGVPSDKIRTISSAVDKLDKLEWEQVKQEMTLEKGLDPLIADQIGDYIQRFQDQDTDTLLARLEQDSRLMSHAGAAQGIADLKLLLEFLAIYNIHDRVKLDLSLARGLDYYTGIIYEAVAEKTEGVGSIAAGGRYDHLVGMFSGTNKAGKPKTIPCVGVSIGVERLFSILMSRQKLSDIKSNKTQVYVISVGDGLLKERMELVRELWDAGIQASFMQKNKPKLEKQWVACEKEHIPFAVIIGQDELNHGQVRIKDMRNKDIEQGGGSLFNRKDMITELKQKITTIAH
ncbi:histidyl-tRNA synthetase [Gilbertella persicaria]|uniref:histidine--tRNA ligase n=1 Tax=Rhizopus stolonifer TaxID=4846 RepID=A0A367JTM2_RHIST|nr:histidyl-tRNA synthetase [Gilbertella persicaria]KAI8097813.1 histidyl-tRNA synthetase [Gilbertella persicaria]RCH93235.1 Cytoplasmic and mitochondrial histidine tRNA synthetase [Rhizopus stolonifer]